MNEQIISDAIAKYHKLADEDVDNTLLTSDVWLEYQSHIDHAIKSNDLLSLDKLWDGSMLDYGWGPDYNHDLYLAAKCTSLATFIHILEASIEGINPEFDDPVKFDTLFENAKGTVTEELVRELEPAFTEDGELNLASKDEFEDLGLLQEAIEYSADGDPDCVERYVRGVKFYRVLYKYKKKLEGVTVSPDTYLGLSVVLDV